MEENARRDPDDSSNRAILPLLQPPANQQFHRITNFYIDTILRPDFGRKRKNGSVVQEEDRLPLIRREELTRGKSGDPLQVGPVPEDEDDTGASDDNHPDLEPRRPDSSKDWKGDSCPQASATPGAKPMLWPAWVYCTRYSDRPSSGPRARKPKKTANPSAEDKRPRTAFTSDQLHRLKTEFHTNRYLTEDRRQSLARELGLNESQIKIWFQNKRAKMKKATGNKNSLAAQLMAQGLYNHSTAKDAKSDSD